MNTVYIPIRGGMTRRGYSPRAEFRIELSEAYPGELEIGGYTWKTGDEMMTLTITAATAEGVLAALRTPGTPDELFRAAARYHSSSYNGGNGEWHQDRGPGAADVRIVTMPAQAAVCTCRDCPGATVPEPQDRPRAWIEILRGEDVIDGGGIDEAGIADLDAALSTWLATQAAARI